MIVLKLKKLIAFTASLVMAISASSVSLCANAYDSGFSRDYIEEHYDELVHNTAASMNELLEDADYGYVTDTPSVVPAKPEQTSFDLRDVDGKCYVPPIKDQGQFGTCWAFSVMAAAEISTMFESGYDLETMKQKGYGDIDYSERHLAWFSFTPLTNDSYYPAQAGEGNTRYRYTYELQKDDPDPEVLYDDKFCGGIFALATTLFSSLQGPCFEEYAPYLSNYYINGSIKFYTLTDEQDPHNTEEAISVEGVESEEFTFENYDELRKLVEERSCIGPMSLTPGYDDWYKGEGVYYRINLDYSKVKAMDWSVAEELRYMGFELDHSSILPSVALSNENGEYQFSEYGLNAIKNELLEGRAVSFALNMARNDPTKTPQKGDYMTYIDENGEITDDVFRAKYWCQYTYDMFYDPDDENSKNKCTGADHGVTIIGYDDNFPKEYFYDPNGTIGGDGAFIVRNSWGSVDTDYSYWGNGGDGYFYISYYDQSLMCFESFDFTFELTENADSSKLSSKNPMMHDLLPSAGHKVYADTDMGMANVFKADYDTRFYCIGFTNVTCNETVEYEIYKLDEDIKYPDEGELVASLSEFYPYAGYHRVYLEEPIYFEAGTRFAVVATVTREDGLNEISAKTGESQELIENQIDSMRQNYIDENGSDEGFEPPYGYIYATTVVNKGESYVYYDGTWLDWADVTAEMDKSKYVLDNFSIQAFTESELYNVTHEEVSPREEPYHAGEVVKCRVTVTNYTSNEEDNVDVYVNGKLIKKLGSIAFNESKVAEYDYTVTEEDEKNGFIRNTAVIKMNYMGDIYIEAETYDEFSKAELVMAAGAKADEKQEEETGQNEEDSKPADEKPTDNEDKPEQQSEEKPAKSEDKPAKTEQKSENKQAANSSANTANPKTSAEVSLAVMAAALVAAVVLKKKDN